MSDKPKPMRAGRLPAAPPGRRGESPFRIADMLALVAALALGSWLVMPMFRGGDSLLSLRLVTASTALLGSIALTGPPNPLIARRWLTRRPLGPGSLVWFATGMATWGLWPALIFVRARSVTLDRSLSFTCYLYVAPLLGLFLTLSLLLSGSWRRGRRPLGWRERVGRPMALAWSAVGGYLLYKIYRDEVF